MTRLAIGAVRRDRTTPPASNIVARSPTAAASVDTGIGAASDAASAGGAAGVQAASDAAATVVVRSRTNILT